MKNIKTYKLEIVTAESYSMESDHFNIKNPTTGNTRYIRPHSSSLRDSRDAHKIINSIWRRCVQVILDRDTHFHKEVYVKGLSVSDVRERMGKAEIDLTLLELNLINEYHGY